jgi:hypothetical protein
MIIYSAFNGDENANIKRAQHHMYGYLLWKIFEKSKNTFLVCDNVCEVLTYEKRINLIEKDSFDHRTLQETHDLIAISFRYWKRYGALTLFEPSSTEIIHYFNTNYLDWTSGNLSNIELIWAYHWDKYFDSNVESITSIKTMLPKFVRNVVNASALNPNNKSGIESKHQLKNILIEYFNLTNVLKE